MRFLNATFQYKDNGQGDRVSQTVGITTTTCTLDTSTSLSAGLAAGLTQVLADGTDTYLYGAGRIAQYGASGAQYFLGDALGSVRQLVDANGEALLAQSYEPYGAVLASVGEGTSSYGFTAEMRDFTGLTYLRARYLDTTTGRFTQADPSRLERNLFLYAAANPIINVDPSGYYFGCNTSNCSNAGTLITWKGMALDSFKQYIQYQMPGHPSGCGPFSLAMAASLLNGNPKYIDGAYVESDLEAYGLKIPNIGIPAAYYYQSVSHILPNAHVEYHTDRSADDLVNGLKQGDLNIVTLSWQTNEQIWDAIRKILDECNKYSDKNPISPLPTFGHYIVMVGYDSGIDKFYFLDPYPRRPDQLTEYPRAEFTQYWEKQPNFIIPARSVTIIR